MSKVTPITAARAQENKNFLEHIEEMYSINSTKIEKIKALLNASLDFRLNIVDGRYEFKKKADIQYRPYTDRAANTILTEIRENFIPSFSATDLQMIVDSDFTPAYNPIDEFFQSLPIWDTKNDYINELAKLVKPTPGQYGDNQDSFLIWGLYLQKWLVATVATMQGKGINHTCLTLLGPHGIGKTTFLYKLCPIDYLVYVGAINPADKDSKILYTEKILIILDELEATTKFELAQLKSNMTLPSITVRRPYARRAEELPRRASFGACANDIQVLADITGSRRWLCVQCDDINYMGVTPELINGAYSQALYLLNNGYKYWFSGDEIAFLERTNERFYISSPEEEALLKLFSPVPFNDVFADYKTNTEILKSLNNEYPSIKFSTKKLGQALTKYKFERGKKSGVYCYALKYKV